MKENFPDWQQDRKKVGLAYCPRCEKIHRCCFPAGYPGKWGKNNDRLPWHHCQECQRKIQEYELLDFTGTPFWGRKVPKVARE